MGVIANDPKIYDLVASSAQVERIATGFTFTEGPVWHPDGYLLFSDMPMDVRRKWTESEGIVEVMNPANKCNGMTLDANRDLIVCEHWTSHVVRAKLNPDGTEASREVIASHHGDKELNSPNDVVVASDGSIYFPDPTYGRMEGYGQLREQDLDFQGVYRIRPGRRDAAPRRRLRAAERALLLARREDALRQRLGGLQPPPILRNGDGSIAGGDVILSDIGSDDDVGAGHCDGMKCDEQGNVWITGPGGVWVVDRTESTSERSRWRSGPAT